MTNECRVLCDVPALGITRFQEKAVEQGREADFLRFESAYLQCANAIPAGTASAKSFREYLSFLFDPNPPALQGNSLGKEIENLSAELESKRTQAEALMERGRIEKLGYYAFEQKADEVSLEILQSTGLPTYLI
jgi:hypothetical protein